MSSNLKFPKSVAEAIHRAKILGIRAGAKPHRIIGIWAVVVEGRVFVRSYSLKERSWYRTFLEDPRGVIEVNGKQYKVRPVFTRSERLKKLVDKAYAEKFPTPGSRVFVEASKKRSDETQRRNLYLFDMRFIRLVVILAAVLAAQ
jgi:hypothetical protein